MTAAWLSAFLFSGYLKDLWRDSRVDQNLFRARACVDAKAGMARAHVEYDHEVKSGHAANFRFLEPRLSWLDLDLVGDAGPNHRWRHRLWRAWGGLETDEWTARAGRQRISWGAGKMWNPTDVLNPYDPAAIERDERAGVDAAYARRALGDLSQAELVWAPHDDWERSFLLGRLRTNERGFDLSLMGGKTAFSTSTWIVGGDFAGDVGQSSVHGEWAVTGGKLRALAGVERSFDDVAMLAEYLYNGPGERDKRRYNRFALLSGREVLLGRHYGGGSLAWEVHPLVKLELYGLASLRDGSAFFNPGASWNALTDLHLTAGWQLFTGRAQSEYGPVSDVAFLQAQYYF